MRGGALWRAGLGPGRIVAMWRGALESAGNPKPPGAARGEGMYSDQTALLFCSWYPESSLSVQQRTSCKSPLARTCRGNFHILSMRFLIVGFPQEIMAESGTVGVPEEHESLLKIMPASCPQPMPTVQLFPSSLASSPGPGRRAQYQAGAAQDQAGAAGRSSPGAAQDQAGAA